MKKTNQQGFGLVVVLLAVVAVSLIGFAGFRIYGNQSDSSSSSQGSEVSTLESKKDIDAADKSLNDPSLDSGVDDSQLDEDLNTLL